MTVVYIVLALLTAALILLLSSKIKLFFEYKKYPGEKLYTKFSVYFGLINLDKFIKTPGEDEINKKAKTKFSAEKIESYAKTFKTLAEIYSKNRWHIQKSLIIENLSIHLKFGLYDAMQTGIMTGALWSLFYSALAFADSVGTVKNHFFEIAPVYTEPGFISQGNVKLTVRFVSALILALRLFTTYKRITKNKN